MNIYRVEFADEEPGQSVFWIVAATSAAKAIAEIAALIGCGKDELVAR